MASNSNSSGGLGLTSVIGVVFIILKLTKVITWSWWWVLSPFWIGAAILLFMALIAILITKILR